MPHTATTVLQPEKNYVKPFIFMVILMALIGFITGMNQQFQVPLRNTFLADAGAAENTLSNLLNFTFFLAYFLIGPFASRYLNKNGYKATLLHGIALVSVSMCIFEASALLYMWCADYGGPAALNSLSLGGISLPLSFFVFIAGSFIAGSGLTYLQSSVNPYIVVCQVPHTSGVTRQNIAGVGNSIMTTLTPLFVAHVIFGGKNTDTLQVNAMVIPFIVLFFLILLLYLGVRMQPLPHLEGTTEKNKVSLAQTVFRYRHLVLGIVAIGVYVGCEVAIGANILTAWEDAFKHSNPAASESTIKQVYQEAALWCSFYWLGMLIGRACSSFLTMISAHRQLAVATAISAILIAVSMLTKNLKILVFVGFFHSVMWGAIFSLAIDGLGKYTALGSGVLLMGLLGGAVLPLLQGIGADLLGGWHYTWLLIIAGELYMFYYAIHGYRVIHPKGLPRE